MDGFITSSYILPGQQIEAELLSFTFRGKDGEDNADSDPSKAFLQITIATKYTGAESGDYLTSETFMITKRSGPGGKNQEGFYLHDADDFLPNRLHIEPQPQKGRVR
jgi:hypothetical protein